MVAIAIGNGTLRQYCFAPRMRELRAHQLSTLTGIVLLGAYIWVIMAVWPPASAGTAAAIGLIWVALTVAFEFGFGHYVAKTSWSRLIEDYNLMRGRVWVLFLIWLGLAPWLLSRF